MTAGRERGVSVVGLLIVVAIIAFAAMVLFGRSDNTPPPTREGGPSTVVGQSLEQGKEVDCANNLRQIRLAIGMQMMDDPDRPTPPASLDEVRRSGVSAGMLNCPVTQTPYQYDPTQGRVWCPTQSHERF